MSSGGVISGNVGIGTNPTYQLHVIGDVLASGSITASNLLILGDTVTLNTTTSNTERFTIVNEGTGPALQVVQTGASPIATFFDDNTLALMVADGGNVGIRTSNPSHPLDVQGNVGVGGTVYAIGFSGDGSSLSNLNASFITSGTVSDSLLPTTGVNATTYGASSQIPIITVDSRGRITNASTSNFTPTQWVDNGSSIYFTNGNVGIGTSTMGYMLQVQGDAYARTLSTKIVYTRLVNETSDVRHKSCIETIEEPLALLSALRGVKFKWTQDDRADMGMIAQEVEMVLPELVDTDETGNKAVAYSHMTGLLVEAVKQQQILIDNLVKDVQELKSLIGQSHPRAIE